MTRADLRDVLLPRQDAVEDGLDLRGQEAPRPTAYTSIAAIAQMSLQAIGSRVAEQAKERVHSVKRYFSSTHSATTPSRHVIFLPSS